jgi:hypothetical protein
MSKQTRHFSIRPKESIENARIIRASIARNFRELEERRKISEEIQKELEALTRRCRSIR